MPSLLTPSEDRIQVYPPNPFYLQYRGQPLFLFGCNQGWTASLQNLDHDYQREFDKLAEVGGNLVRITPFICPKVDDETRFDDRSNNLPWRREGGLYHLDLEHDGGNPRFWDRLAELVAFAYERNIVISFEFWDLYGPARGPGGNLAFRTPPGDRWSAHPFFPGNSSDLQGDDQLPAQTHMRDIAFCRPVTRGGYARALQFQEQYVRRLLDVLSPYPNIIYCMVNETSADKSWSDHWLNFTHRYFAEVWDNAPHLAGEMPREYTFTENFTVEDMLEDDRYDFADTSQYYTGTGLVEMRKVKSNLPRFYAHCRQTGQVKPLTCMKIYNRLAPAVLWMRLFGGAASARYHRVIYSNFQPQSDPALLAQQQLDLVGHMARFLHRTDFQPWAMQPDDELVIDAPRVDETLAMAMPDRKTGAVLLFNENEPVSIDRRLTLDLAGGTVRYFWLNPATGDETPLASATIDRAGKASWPVPPTFSQAVFYYQLA